ncbi:hypothetical protein BLX87_23430 [Bacillus sp. VT-16-64]|nr:hypothetical protein BLX87_23430 [Bacillus sp. VT-16-64]
MFSHSIIQKGRSPSATYTGIMDTIRDSFAQANKGNKSLFSFNSKGACPECQGNGFTYTDLAFLESVGTVLELLVREFMANPSRMF